MRLGTGPSRSVCRILALNGGWTTGFGQTNLHWIFWPNKYKIVENFLRSWLGPPFRSFIWLFLTVDYVDSQFEDP